MNLKEFYLKKYPTDDMGSEINEKATFTGLYHNMLLNKDIYVYIGANDSVVRERIFQKLADLIHMPYKFIYDLWLHK